MTNTPRQGWSQSARWRRIASEHCKRMNADPNRPRCGAKRRSTGEPCRNVAMANGRCYIHGGRTPKGDDWHKPKWPNGERPDASAKLSEKLRSLDKRDRQRRARLKTMSAEERAAHDAWQASHKPGPAAARRRLRVQKLQKQEAARILSGAPVKPSSPPPAPKLNERKEPTPMREIILPPDASPAIVEADLADRVRTEGIKAAYEAALEVCRDKKAAPAARATAAGWIFRIAGFDAKKNDGAGRQLHEMTAEELAAEHQKAQEELARLQALQSRGRRSTAELFPENLAVDEDDEPESAFD